MSWWKLRKNLGKILGNEGKVREFHGIKKWAVELRVYRLVCDQCQLRQINEALLTALWSKLDHVVFHCLTQITWEGLKVHSHLASTSAFAFLRVIEEMVTKRKCKEWVLNPFSVWTSMFPRARCCVFEIRRAPFAFEFKTEQPNGNSEAKQLPNYQLAIWMTFPNLTDGNLATVLSTNCHSAVQTQTQMEPEAFSMHKMLTFDANADVDT